MIGIIIIYMSLFVLLFNLYYGNFKISIFFIVHCKGLFDKEFRGHFVKIGIEMM